MQKYIKLCLGYARAPSETPLLSAWQCFTSRRDNVSNTRVNVDIGQAAMQQRMSMCQLLDRAACSNYINHNLRKSATK